MRRALPLLILSLALVAWFELRPTPAAVTAAPTATATADDAPAPLANSGTVASVDRDPLPPEARDTLRLIAAGSPFPYDRDGIVFGNYEHRLPEHARGYYREYTVPTPGAGNRGARRIIVGGDPPERYYYTDDHYRSFRPIEGSP